MRNLLRGGQRLWGKPVWRVLILVIIAGTLGATIGRRFLGTVSIVSGSSMSPNFPPGTWVYTRAISGPLERGDVVLLDDGYNEPALKRIVGLPGESVCVHRGYVFINGRILMEPYIPKQVYTIPRRRVSVFVLGPDEFFVLGDNRPKSSDSRIYGPITREQIRRQVPLPAGSDRPYFGPVHLPIYQHLFAVQTVPKLEFH